MNRKIKLVLKIISIFTLLLFLNCNKKISNKYDLPEKFPLKVGNTWIYKNLIYTPKDTVLTYDTLCVIGKYKDFYEYTYGYSKIRLVKNEAGKFLSFGYIQLADTIHGSIFNGDSFYYEQPRILNSDTVLFKKPRIIAIFNIDTGYVDIDTSKYALPKGEDSLHLSIKKNYKFNNKFYDAYVIRYISSCPGVYCRYLYYTRLGKVYEKSISKDKKDVVQEIILDKFVENYHLKNLKFSNSKKYY
jgi:hypothetical protein